MIQNSKKAYIIIKPLKISCRLNMNNKKYKVFPVYYPVGQGTRNIKKAKEDILYIKKMI